MLRRTLQISRIEPNEMRRMNTPMIAMKSAAILKERDKMSNVKQDVLQEYVFVNGTALL